MMPKQTFWLAILFFMLLGCKKEEQIPVAGEVTMNSTLYGTGPYWAIGYSFSQGKLLEYRDGNVPDIIILPKTEANGTVRNAFLDSPNVFPSFSLNGTFGGAQEAETFFNNYVEAVDSGFIALADPLLTNQVWTFKTATGKYVKMLILEVTATLKDQVPYAEVRFRYVYQPDGSTVFSQ